MQERQLGPLHTSAIGLGCMGMTPIYGEPDTDECIRTIHRALDLGVTMIDTADMYGGGRNEELVGQALAGRRQGVVLATKFGNIRTPEGGRDVNGHPDYVPRACEASLKRLGVDDIDLYYLHRVDPETPLEESLGAIKAYVDRGAIRHVGISEVSVEQIARARRTVAITAVQNRYNVADRRHDDVIDFCEREQIAFVPYYPLRGDGGPGLAAAAERLGVTENAIKLAWLVRRSPVVLPIPGTLSIEHLRENLAALEIELEDADSIAA